MGDALKTFFSPALVRRIAGTVAAVEPAFLASAFRRDACQGLNDLELLARGHHIARALHTYLSRSYAKAVEVLVRSLGPDHTTRKPNAGRHNVDALINGVTFEIGAFDVRN